MILTFENTYGVERTIANVLSEEEAFREIHKFLREHNFKSYYTKITRIGDDHTIYDVGSYTEFFHLYNKDSGV